MAGEQYEKSPTKARDGEGEKTQPIKHCSVASGWEQTEQQAPVTITVQTSSRSPVWRVGLKLGKLSSLPLNSRLIVLRPSVIQLLYPLSQTDGSGKFFLSRFYSCLFQEWSIKCCLSIQAPRCSVSCCYCTRLQWRTSRQRYSWPYSRK